MLLFLPLLLDIHTEVAKSALYWHKVKTPVIYAITFRLLLYTLPLKQKLETIAGIKYDYHAVAWNGLQEIYNAKLATRLLVPVCFHAQFKVLNPEKSGPREHQGLLLHEPTDCLRPSSEALVLALPLPEVQLGGAMTVHP